MKSAPLFLCLFTMTACSTAYGWQDLQLQRILRNVHKVNTFEGTVVERGTLPEEKEVKTHVLFERPNHFAARVVEPAEWADTTVTYDGKTLVHHYPKLHFAIRFKNLALPTGADADKLIEYQYRRDLAGYEYSIRGSSKVANLETVTLWHSAKSKDATELKGWHKVYDPYSFALAGELSFQGDVHYEYRYDKIVFNGVIDSAAFEPKIPEGSVTAEWDLGAAPVEEAKMREEVKFALVLPDTNRDGLVRKQIVRAAGPIPAYAVRYERGAHFVWLIAFAAMGSQVEYGVPIKIRETTGHLILGPAMSSLAFIHGGTAYTLFGNISFEELIALGQKITMP